MNISGGTMNLLLFVCFSKLKNVRFHVEEGKSIRLL